MTTLITAPGKAAAAILAGMFTLGFTDNLVALVTADSSLAQFHLLRSVLVCVVLILASYLGAGAVWPKRPLAVWGRSALTAGAMVIYFGCIAVLPIGIVVAGLFTAPLFVLLISVALQGKKVGAVRSVAVVLGFAGAVMVIRPNPADIDWIALLPVLAGMLYAGGAVAMRAWCEGEDTLCMSFWFFALLLCAGALGVAVLPSEGSGAAGFVWRGWMPLTPVMMGWYVAMSIGAVIGIALIFRGYQLAEASFVAVFEYSLLVFASVWAFVLWDQTLPPLAIVGMGLIAMAGITIIWRGDGA